MQRNAPTYLLAALAFISGTFLIFIGATQFSPLSEYYCFGEFFSCPNSGFSLCWLIIGSILVFLSYPITKMKSGDSDESLLWNKRVSGISLALSGTMVASLGFVALIFFAPQFNCSVYGCPTIFNLSYIDYWIDIFYGLSLLALGMGLLALNSRNEGKILQELQVSARPLP